MLFCQNILRLSITENKWTKIFCQNVNMILLYAYFCISQDIGPRLVVLTQSSANTAGRELITRPIQLAGEQ